MKTEAAFEVNISKAIRQAILRQFPGAVVRKRHVEMGIAGDPDIYGCIGGRHFELEVKRPGNDPTTLQLVRLSQWTKAGSITGVARSVEQAIEILTKAMDLS